MNSFSSDGVMTQAYSTLSVSSPNWDQTRPTNHPNYTLHDYGHGDNEIPMNHDIDTPALSSQDSLPLEIGDQVQIRQFYHKAFIAIQQTNCKALAKPIIKMVEPRKQVKYPYNGGKNGQPEATKPLWWPGKCAHQEPDHLSKPGMVFG
jgi:hypothetical protein